MHETCFLVWVVGGVCYEPRQVPFGEVECGLGLGNTEGG